MAQSLTPKPATKGTLPNPSSLAYSPVSPQVLAMVNASLRSGPSLMQSEVTFSHSVKLTAKLLQLQEKFPMLRPNLSNFQLQMSKSISDVLESENDVAVRWVLLSTVGGSGCGLMTWLWVANKKN